MLILPLVAAVPVGHPVLEVHDLAGMRVGDLLKATCRAPPGVPPANLTWHLGDAEVRRDSANDTLPGDVGRFTLWQAQPVVQTLSRRLTKDDLGKRLECRMHHQGLGSAVRSQGQNLLIGESLAWWLDCYSALY
jgi:CD80-like C2-set immunoglobulin domain